MTYGTADPRGLLEFARLLEYPRPGYQEMVRSAAERSPAGGPVGEALDEELARFLVWASSSPLSEMEETYTATFDLRPLCPPYVGPHLFADPAARSVFLAELASLYKRRGFDRGAELPDHLPLMLRFLAGDPASEESREILVDAVIPAVSRMAAVLGEASSPFSPAFEALRRTIEEAGRRSDVRRQLGPGRALEDRPGLPSEVDPDAGPAVETEKSSRMR